MTNTTNEILLVDLFTEAVSNLPIYQTLAAEDVPTSTIFDLYVYNGDQTGGSFLERTTSLVEIDESLGGNQIFSCTIVELLGDGEGYAMINGKEYSLQEAVDYAELAMLEFHDRSAVDHEYSKLAYETEFIISTLATANESKPSKSQLDGVTSLAIRLNEIQRRLNIVNNIVVLRQLR